MNLFIDLYIVIHVHRLHKSVLHVVAHVKNISFANHFILYLHTGESLMSNIAFTLIINIVSYLGLNYG